MNTSGTTAVATGGAAAVALIAASTPPRMFNYLVIANEGAAAGFFSVDGGTVWGRLPAAATTVWRGRASGAVMIKRDTSDMSGVFGFCDCLDGG